MAHRKYVYPRRTSRSSNARRRITRRSRSVAGRRTPNRGSRRRSYVSTPSTGRTYRNTPRNYRVRSRVPIDVDSSSGGSGIDTSSKTVLVNRFKMSKSLKYMGRFYHIQNHVGMIGSQPGSQGVGIIAWQNTRSQFLDDTGYSYGVDQASESYWHMNPNQKTTGGHLWTTVVSDPKNAYLMMLKNHFQIMCTNMTSIDSLVDVYIWLVKKNTDNQPFTAWQDDLTAQAVGIAPMTFDTAGIKSNDDTSLGAQLTGYPGERPGGRTFGRFYKLLASRRMKLAAGATEEASFNIILNKLLRRDYLDMNEDPYMGGFTIVAGLVARSQLVYINTTGGAAGGQNVSYGETRIGYACKSTVTMSTLFGQASMGSRLAISSAPAGLVGVGQAILPTQQVEINDLDAPAQVQHATTI